MPSDTVTLRLEGDIGLDHYARAVGRFEDLVESLTKDIAAGVGIDWTLDDLASLPTSAETTAFGRATEREPVHAVTAGYLSVGRALSIGQAIPYANPVKDAARHLQEVLNGRVRTLVFETADDEATVLAAPSQSVSKQRKIETQGAVTGRLQTMTSRGSLRFTLYDVLHDRAVSCYLAEDREDLMLGAWGKLAVVEGLVRRDPETGRPLSIRHVRDVTIRPDDAPDAYIQARGAVEGPFLMSVEDAIRRVRDGQ